MNQVYIVCVTDEFLPTPIDVKSAGNLSEQYKKPTFFVKKNQAENEAKRLNRLCGHNQYMVITLEEFIK